MSRGLGVNVSRLPPEMSGRRCQWQRSVNIEVLLLLARSDRLHRSTFFAASNNILDNKEWAPADLLMKTAQILTDNS